MISPLYDYVFSEIFCNQKNIDWWAGYYPASIINFLSNEEPYGNHKVLHITRNFLKTLLDIPEDEYDQLTVVNSILRRLFKTEKSGVVDLKLSTKSGKIIHIELQVGKRNNLRSRIFYYTSRLIGEQLKWREDYSELHQVISIVICNHNLLREENSYINRYELMKLQNSQGFRWKQLNGSIS